MPRTPYLAGASGFSSILSLATVTLPSSSSLIYSSAGAIIRQGPHHSAQKSTSTGSEAPSTSVWNEASVTVLVVMMISWSFETDVGCGRRWNKRRRGRPQAGKAAAGTAAAGTRHGPGGDAD